MYIFKNALKNLGRNKGRNIMIGVIIFAIIATTAVSLIINNTSGKIIDDYKSRFGAEVLITLNQKKIADNPNSKLLVPELYSEFIKSDLLKEAKITAVMTVVSDDITCIDYDGGSMSESMKGSSDDFVLPEFMVIGSNDVSGLNDFKNGERNIVEGKPFEALDECIISSELAKLNNIKIGDKISFKNSRAVKSEGAMSLTVTGIYNDLTKKYAEDYGMSLYYLNRRNEILTSSDTITKTNRKNLDISCTFYLKSPDDLEAFSNELYKKGLPDVYDVTTDEASYNKIVAPVEGMKNITMTFMIIVLIMGAVILILLSTIAMRERKYEVGVLRAMGMEKGKVAIGLLCEMLVITSLCLVLGLGIGRVTAQPVSNMLLQGQIKAAESGQGAENGGATGGRAGSPLIPQDQSNVETLKELQVGMDMNTVFEIILIALLLAGVSSVMGIVYITRYEPIKILNERN